MKINEQRFVLLTGYLLWWPGQESESKSAHEQHEGVHLARLPLSPLRDRRGLSASHSSDEFNLAWPRRESRIGGGLQPLYLLFLLGSLWDHFAPGVPHQGNGSHGRRATVLNAVGVRGQGGNREVGGGLRCWWADRLA